MVDLKALTFERDGSDVHVYGEKIDLHFPNGTRFLTATDLKTDGWSLFAWDQPTRES